MFNFRRGKNRVAYNEGDIFWFADMMVNGIENVDWNKVSSQDKTKIGFAIREAMELMEPFLKKKK